MNHFIACAVLALAATSVAAQDTRPKYAYTGAVDQPVISLDYQGSRVARIGDAPTLSIFADGRVEMPKNYAHMQAYSSRISQQQLQALLDLIVREKHFFEYDPRQVRSKIAALPGPRQVLPAHLPTTVITVTANGSSKSVSHVGLGHGRTIEETERLLQVRERLEQVMAMTRLGGEAASMRWLALANAELADQLPDAALLVIEDLRSAAIHPDGSAYVRFARIGAEPTQSISVAISLDAHGTSRIAVDRDPARQSTTLE